MLVRRWNNEENLSRYEKKWCRPTER